jgi:hypothetical protein
VKPTPSRLLLVLTVLSAVGCEVLQRSPETGAGAVPTAPSSLKRVVDDIPGGESVTTSAETTGCLEPPCDPTPPPDPKPQPVAGRFAVSSADGSSLTDTYTTITTPAGAPQNGIVGNIDGSRANGTGRFDQVSAMLFSVQLTGSTATLTLRWSIAQKGIPDGYRSYGDSVTVPYSSQKSADSDCESGYRVTVEMSGRMENFGPFTAQLNHCVSPLK